jgi:hypothetical protein
MGANAVTTVPVYTAGEVLTAADMNITNSGIPVFADSTARTAAFGGTGEKVLAEGQYAYLESDNSTSVYDGSNWVSVGVAPGLVLVKTETVGSGVASVTVTNAFSATYDNYKIIANGVAASASGSVSLQFTGLTTGYYGGLNFGPFTSGGAVVAGYNNTAVVTHGGGTDGAAFFLNADVTSPFLAKPTSYSTTYIDNTNLGFVFAKQTSNTSTTGFTITPSAGTLTGGTIRIYGYANS